MMFPLLQIPGLGNGMTIALDAVPHVVISHGVAIGTISIIVLFQTLAYAGKGEHWARTARTLLNPVVVVVTSIGAITGVGIWVITGALAPEGIGSLIHLFFWPWFIEWGAFTGEVIFLLALYYNWDKLVTIRPGLLVALGWGYVGMGVASAVLISGVLGFMLTPGGWPWAKSFAEAYFNPTFVPQVVLRLAGGLTLGSLFIMTWAAWRFKGWEEERGSVLRLAGGILPVAMLVAAISAYIYFSRVPQTYLTHWKFAVGTSALSQAPHLLPLANAVACLLILAMGLAAFFRRAALCRVLCIPAILFSFALVAEFERVREFVRGPYLLPGYMYANQVLLIEHAAGERTDAPFLPNIRWVSGKVGQTAEMTAGQAIFAANCGMCHSGAKGVNAISTRAAGRPIDGINAIIGMTQGLGPFMPPFTGSEQERLLLADYIYKLANGDAPHREPGAKGKKP
ncbi:MAG: c-type cytochrome [Deltaproteobacteria bacterium]|jgi:mono/diheme cytochrome c family protein|nr:c-type cytochrome [Deltaproteobacteria bacterium]